MDVMLLLFSADPLLAKLSVMPGLAQGDWVSQCPTPVDWWCQVCQWSWVPVELTGGARSASGAGGQTAMALPLHGLAAHLGARPTRHSVHTYSLQVSEADARMFPGTVAISGLAMRDLRLGALCSRQARPLLGLHKPPPGCPNMGYLVVGMVPQVPGEHPDNLQRRKNWGDLGLQFDPVGPLVVLPSQDREQGRARLVQGRAGQCVVGLVQILRRSVPKFWEAEWDLLSLQDFSQDPYSLTSDAILFLSGVLKFADLVRGGSFPHDAYLAWVGAPAQLGGGGVAFVSGPQACSGLRATRPSMMLRRCTSITSSVHRVE